MEEDEEYPLPRKCRHCQYYGYDECPEGGCMSEDDEDDEEW